MSPFKNYGPCEPRLISNLYLRKLKGMEYSCPDCKRSHRIRSIQRIPFLEPTLSSNIYTVSDVCSIYSYLSSKPRWISNESAYPFIYPSTIYSFKKHLCSNNHVTSAVLGIRDKAEQNSLLFSSLLHCLLCYFQTDESLPLLHCWC